MKRKNTAIALVLIPTLLVSACASAPEESEDLFASGAKSGVSVVFTLAEQAFRIARPGAPLGVFTSIYLAQGFILPVQSALIGMEAMARYLEGQLRSDTNENFAMLKEVGAVLQVDVIDMLNRSPDRPKALDAYTQSLRNAGILIERKITELQVVEEQQKDTVRERRTAARDTEKKLRDALKEQRYAEAGEYEEEVAKANAAYAESETRYEQSSDMIQRLEALEEVAAERLQAVVNNREILIAGLRVIDVPGIADFNILEEGKSWRRRGGSSIFGE